MKNKSIEEFLQELERYSVLNNNMSLSGVYMLTSPNGKNYVGQAYNLEYRIKRYTYFDCKHQFALHNAFIKYGWESFKITLLYYTFDQTNIEYILNQLEEDFIFIHNAMAPDGYNLREGGSNGKMSDTSRARMSKTQTARWAGLTLEEKLAKMAEMHKGNEKKVNQYTKRGKYIKTWDSLSEAAESLGMKTVGNITSVCRGDRITSGGFTWRYEAESPRGDIKIEERIYKLSKHTHRNLKPINQYSKQGDFIKTWDSATTVQQQLGISKSNIGANLSGRSKTAGGFIWEYLIK